ncbi:hypothetical protein [uncultured Algoriphagus sp.]|uniref:hypothetical protein n=1 Tax=uncultured Algoriphagus sp. TaxID=417365 RepID=UPI0030ED483E|tara:strand:- start:8567 stop:9175 length:609 start_codon:yes stop_codon:yes gene_type:complete
MSCPHRFINDLRLQYVDWEVRTLFIGTFNPAWDLPNNSAEWFYGRTARNDFWGILPTIHIGHSMIPGTPEDWKNFCRNHHIAVTDIITCLNDADINNPTHLEMVKRFKDDQLAKFDIESTNIPALLEHHKEIKQICLTRKTLPSPWNQLFQPTFDWVTNHPERNIQFKRLRSPSRGARRGVKGGFTEFTSTNWKTIGDYQIL